MVKAYRVNLRMLSSTETPVKGVLHPRLRLLAHTEGLLRRL
jgi:hypothetical protein